MFRLCVSNFSLLCRRSIAVSAERRYKDPIYEIFLAKVKEYREKSPTGKPLDAGPEFEKELNETLEKLALKYGGGEGVDMLEFPKFKEPEVTLDPLSIFVKLDGETQKMEDSKQKPEEMKAAAEEGKKTKDQEKTQEPKAKAKDNKDSKAPPKDAKAPPKDTKSPPKDTKDTKAQDDKKKK
ncbi:uncharacterized protein ATPsynCF6L [Drosophila pseudoobscura]|uniref:Uncharacterized protein ATPsynCF6L n=1 Tax=Drosophila pseudoobscura pseudoobscura TaxID=46245 RepID=A0A6I8UB04_DROPS|nr:uncharacterized protein LOC4812477 [Drosophila pseudoobscura]